MKEVVKNRKSPAAAMRPSGAFLGILAAFIVVMGAGVAWIAVSRHGNSGGDVAEENPAKRIAAVLPSGAGRKVAVAAADAAGEPTGSHAGDVSSPDVAEDASAGSAASGANGANQAGEPPRIKKKRVFQSGTDQLIAMATSAPEGDLIPPLPMMSSAETDEFIESLDKPIVIEDDDTEAVKKVKERVQAIRHEIAKVLADNPDMEIGDVLNEHREIFNDNSKIRADVMAELDKIIAEGDEEGACKYRDTMNYALQQMGIAVIDTPITLEEREAAGEFDEEEYEEAQ